MERRARQASRKPLVRTQKRREVAREIPKFLSDGIPRAVEPERKGKERQFHRPRAAFVTPWGSVNGSMLNARRCIRLSNVVSTAKPMRTHAYGAHPTVRRTRFRGCACTVENRRVAGWFAEFIDADRVGQLRCRLLSWTKHLHMVTCLVVWGYDSNQLRAPRRPAHHVRHRRGGMHRPHRARRCPRFLCH